MKHEDDNFFDDEQNDDDENNFSNDDALRKFSSGNFDDDDDEVNDDEIRKEIEEDHQKLRNLPVYKQAKRLMELVLALVDAIDDDHKMKSVTEIMLQDAMMLCPKIAGAHGCDIYQAKIENAMLIRYHAKSLYMQYHTLKMFKLCDDTYAELIKNESIIFKKLFLEWVAAFDKSTDEKDEWGNFYFE
ncbi:MAG: hypothetical protein RIQ33_1576 [Bacteroidota bacterium]|jgi:hypothetical protein